MAIGDGVGQRIRQVREARKITASELARQAGVTPTAVWNWENNETAPRRPAFGKVAAALGVSEDYLLTGDEETGEAPGSKDSSVAEIIEQTRVRIAKLTGFRLDRVKLHLEFVAD